MAEVRPAVSERIEAAVFILVLEDLILDYLKQTRVNIL